MKTITVEELHARTSDYVRAAATEPIAIAEEGRHVAMLTALRGVEMPGKLFPVRNVETMPKATIETSSYVSDERNAR